MNKCYATLLSKRFLHSKYAPNLHTNDLKLIHKNAVCSLSPTTATIRNNKPLLFPRASSNNAMLQIHTRNNFSTCETAYTHNRGFSSSTATTKQSENQPQSSSASTSNSKSDTNDNKSNKKEDDSNIFLDNLGKVFFGVIFTIIFLLVRSSKATTNRANLREYLEEHSLLDPCEIDDLRVANSLFTPDVFRDIMSYIHQHYGSSDNVKIRYSDFLSMVRYKMKELKGEDFTIQLGHLLDRIVINKLEEGGGDDEDEEALLSLEFLLTVLTLALSCSTEERVDILYEIMPKTTIDDDGTTRTVSDQETIQMIKYLQDTYQLDNDAQILDKPEEKYPIQQYAQGIPVQLLQEARKEYNEKFGIQLKKGSYTEFDCLLRSQYICAWGECYGHRKLQKQK